MVSDTSAPHITDVKVTKNRQNKSATKFKVRCSKYIYTYIAKDKKNAERLVQAIGTDLPKRGRALKAIKTSA